jgi:hypothetical protein
VVANMTAMGGTRRWTPDRSTSTNLLPVPSTAPWLIAEVMERLRWLAWRATGRGLFETVGVPADVRRHFSQRRAEIEERAVELAGIGATVELSRGADARDRAGHAQG